MTTTSETASNSIQDMLCTLSRNWWLFGLRGVLALMIAGLAFLMPAESLLALTLVFGAFSFADGVFGLVAGAGVLVVLGWLMVDRRRTPGSRGEPGMTRPAGPGAPERTIGADV